MRVTHHREGMNGGAGTIRQAAMAILVVAAIALAFAAIRPGAVPDGEVRRTLYVFGTLVEVVVRHAPREQAMAAIDDVETLFSRLHRDWHAWLPGGELSRVNEAIANGTPAPVGAELEHLLIEAQRASIASGGLFEPAIGGLIAAWGFHNDDGPSGPPPAEQTIAELVAAHPRIGEVTIGGGQVVSANRSVRMDLGGFAKGAALDLAAKIMAAHDITDAVLNAGGDLNVLGTYGGRPWRIAIRDPFAFGAIAAVALEPGEVLYTSGNYERYIEHDGHRFAHIIDPRTGRPVEDIVSASVLDTRGAWADAAATALSVAGSQDWPKVAAAMGLTDVVVIDAAGRMYATPAMARRLEVVAGRPAPTIVALPTMAAAAGNATIQNLVPAFGDPRSTN